MDRENGIGRKFGSLSRELRIDFVGFEPIPETGP
jgi:hypothetical protein